MKGRITLLSGIAVAIVISLVAALLLFFLTNPISPRGAGELSMMVSTAIYLRWLFRRRSIKVGQVALGISWICIALCVFLFTWHWLLVLALCAFSIWIVRSLLFYRSFLSACCDAGLIAAGLAFAAFALDQTNSLVFAIWCFFLMQALAGFIPAQWQRLTSGVCAASTAARSTFDRSFEVAEQALRDIVQSSS